MISSILNIRYNYLASSQQRRWNNNNDRNSGESSGMIQSINPRNNNPNGTGQSSSILDADDGTVFEKSNVLLIGPTGSGKTKNKQNKNKQNNIRIVYGDFFRVSLFCKCYQRTSVT